MLIHYKLSISNTIQKNTSPIVMIHGLFGDLNNLRKISVNLSQDYHVIQLDLRNHGQSPHTQSMTYSEMAKDILDILDQLCIQKFIVVGHSMGGKVAMKLCMLAGHRIKKTIVIDIAPVKYTTNNIYNKIFNAIECVNRFGVKNKNDAEKFMKQYIIDQSLILFLLKSFRKGIWCFNFLSIKKNLDNINNWKKYQTWWGPILFIKGECSSYINNHHINDIYHQFPCAHMHIIPNANHWVHYENSECVSSLINEFICN